MRRFLVTDDQGNPVFVDAHFDPDMARMLCLPFATTQDVMQSVFREKFTAMRCGDSQFVFTQYDELLYMVVSDEGESMPFLRRQLQLIHELLLFKFGPKPTNNHTPMHRQTSKYAAVLRPLIHTMGTLGSAQQSYLVQSIERLEVNDDLRARCMTSLEEACMVHRGHGAAHVLLFVGAKLVAHYSRSDSLRLSPSDMFLISLYIRSLQEPQRADAPTTSVPPMATSLANDQFASPSSDNIKLSDPEDEFVLAREDHDAEDGEGGWAGGARTVTTTGARDAGGERGPDGDQDPQEFDMNDVGDEPAPAPDRPSLDSDNMSAVSQEAPPELSVLERLYLRTPNYAPYTVYMGQVAPMTTMVVISDSMKGSDQERPVMALMQQSIQRSLSNFIDFLIIKEQTHLTVLSFLSHFPGLVHFIHVDRSNHQVIAPVIIPLDNELDAYAQATASIASAAAPGAAGPGAAANASEDDEDDTAQLAQAQTAKSSPEPQRNASTQAPPPPPPPSASATGSVPASGEPASPDPQQANAPPAGTSDPGDLSSWSTLKRRVWEMVFCAQDRLSQGYTSMVMQAGGFQYSYHLWFEDIEGNILPIEQPLPSPELSYDGSFYREMTRRLFPAMHTRVNCYELYTLHLAAVPSRTLVAHNRRLIRKLREGRVSRRPVL